MKEIYNNIVIYFTNYHKSSEQHAKILKTLCINLITPFKFNTQLVVKVKRSKSLEIKLNRNCSNKEHKLKEE